MVPEHHKFAWVDTSVASGLSTIQTRQRERHDNRDLPEKPQVIEAKRPYKTGTGRCIAIRLSRGSLEVLVASPLRTTRWMPATAVLSNREADDWARRGF